MKDIRQKLLATFQIEHRDHVEQIRSLMAMIEKTTGPPQGPGLDEAFRRAHSLKGAARAVDLRPVEGLAHRLETLFSRVRQGTLALDESVTGAVQQALDASEDCVMALGDNRPTPGFGAALRTLERVLDLQPEEGAATTASAKPKLEAKPESQAESQRAPEVSAPAFQPLDVVRITATNFDGLLRSAGGLLSEGQRQSQLGAQLQGLAERIAGMEKKAAGARRQLAAAPGYARIRSYLDASERQTRELANQARSVRRTHRRCSWTINHLGKQLQRDVWQARMVPAESLLEGYRKVMRDLARDEGKVIEFRAASTGVQADRRILEALKDPLLHVLRNAVGHGIERPEERVAKGKPAAGQVSLRIDSVGRRLTVAIEDDGRGVDFARAAQVALQQGILPEGEAKSPSPAQMASILFRAGFSTASSVTELSGRGMGLSVVYETIRRLEGTAEIRPREGGGTRVQLSIPLSIATHQLLLAGCGGQLFALPLDCIERLHRIPLKNIATAGGAAVTLLDRQTVPVVSLRQMLGLQNSREQAESGEPHAGPAGASLLAVAVVRLKEGPTALVVDEFVRPTEAVVQNLGSVARAGITGGILLEDGQIAMVLNPQELMDGAAANAHVFPTSTSAAGKIQHKPAQERAPRSILVVDDSMTTRTLEKSILEAHGYRVQVAVDGVEALACLRREKAELVITDVEMPRMDGFGLLEAMKLDTALNKIPVIVVTSLDRREDQERGLRLGADAYIVKRKFDQAELLATIRQIL